MAGSVADKIMQMRGNTSNKTSFLTALIIDCGTAEVKLAVSGAERLSPLHVNYLNEWVFGQDVTVYFLTKVAFSALITVLHCFAIPESKLVKCSRYKLCMLARPILDCP